MVTFTVSGAFLRVLLTYLGEDHHLFIFSYFMYFRICKLHVFKVLSTHNYHYSIAVHQEVHVHIPSFDSFNNF